MGRGDEIKNLQKTVGGDGCENFSEKTPEHEEKTRYYHGKRDIEIDIKLNGKTILNITYF